MDQSALDWAAELQNTQDRLFWDSTNFGYFYSQENAANVVLRLKDDSDGAEPCGNSVAASNLQLLAQYFENDAFKRSSTQLFQYFSGTTLFGYVLPEMMSALLLFDTGLPTFVFIGELKTIYIYFLFDQNADKKSSYVFDFLSNKNHKNRATAKNRKQCLCNLIKLCKYLQVQKTI